MYFFQGIRWKAILLRKRTMSAAQQRFAEEVEAYQTGLFRSSWEEIGELLSAVSEALSNRDALAGRLVFTPVGQPVNVGWLNPPDQRDPLSGLGQSALEVYLTPLGAAVTSARLRAAGDVAGRLLRELGQVGHNEAIDVSARADGGITARAVRPPGSRLFNEVVLGGHVEGVAVARSGEVCAWASLRRDHFGAVVDAGSLAEAAAPLVVLAGRVLGEVVSDTSVEVVPSVAVTGARGVSLGRPDVVGNRSASTMAMTGVSVIVLPGDESATLSAVVSGARDVGAELGARAEHALRNR